MLKKKSSSIVYHFVREGAARNEWRVTYINTNLNIADLLTKPLPGGEKRSRFVGMILHHISWRTTSGDYGLLLPEPPILVRSGFSFSHWSIFDTFFILNWVFKFSQYETIYKRNTPDSSDISFEGSDFTWTSVHLPLYSQRQTSNPL